MSEGDGKKAVYWQVWNRAGKEPVVKHLRYEEALAEAERLSEKEGVPMLVIGLTREIVKEVQPDDALKGRLDLAQYRMRGAVNAMVFAAQDIENAIEALKKARGGL